MLKNIKLLILLLLNISFMFTMSADIANSATLRTLQIEPIQSQIEVASFANDISTGFQSVIQNIPRTWIQNTIGAF